MEDWQLFIMRNVQVWENRQENKFCHVQPCDHNAHSSWCMRESVIIKQNFMLAGKIITQKSVCQNSLTSNFGL